MAHTNYGAQSGYIIKCRDRVQREVAIFGGTKRGAHRRRVTSWSKWVGVRYGISTEEAAREDLAQRDRHAPLTQFAIFYRGNRLPDRVNG